MPSRRQRTRRVAAVPDRDHVERAALIALLRDQPAGLTWTRIAIEAGQRGDALSLWHELHRAGPFHEADLFHEDHEDDAPPAPVAAAADAIVAWQADGSGLLTVFDDEYPAQLREIHEIPPVIFYRGTPRSGETAVSIVGSRSASSRGLDIARHLSAGLVTRGITVVSGLARGIDTAAHTAALEASGRTVAVLGCGTKHYYPPENRELQDRIATEGLVISQFFPETAPRRQQFPMRNAVMSGYSRVTVVVEAGEKSGARIQARQAVEHGRPVILSDLVVDSNEWARQLVRRPGVYVARGTTEVMKLIEDIVTADDEIDQMLTSARR